MNQAEEEIQDAIKQRVTAYQTSREVLWKEIEREQQACQHPRTYEGNYSWRIGCVDAAIICSDCGKMIRLVNPYPQPIVTYTHND